jgi:perosamine synthetase
MLDITKKYRPNEKDYIYSFENELRLVLDAKNVLTVSSGTASIIAALNAIGIKEGDEVITSPISPLCTAYPILYSGGKLVLADTQKSSFGLSLESIKERLTSKTKVILDVPMWGYSIEANQIRNFEQDNGLYLIFDLAHCLGTKFENISLSKFCDIACFSTQENKIISTGEGGFLVTDNDNLFERAVNFTKMGQLDGINFGINFKMSPAQAKLGLKNLKELDLNLENRYINSQKIIRMMKNESIEPFKEIKNGCSSFHRLIVKSMDTSKNLSKYMHSNGIPSDIIKYNAQPLYNFPILKSYIANCPNSVNLINSITTIPVHFKYSEDDFNYIANTLNKFQQRFEKPIYFNKYLY